MLEVYRPESPLPEIEPVYEEDSSDEEELNTIGNIPVEWYDDLPHIGYSIDGKPILRKTEKKDRLDKLLDSVDDPNSWRTVYDRKNDREIILTDEDLKILKSISKGEFINTKIEEYEDFTIYALGAKEITPVSGAPEPKRRFIPSKIEKYRIIRIADAIKTGRVILEKPKVERPIVDIWENEAGDCLGDPNYIPAPKLALPENNASYNPPGEYLFTKEEEKKWLSIEKYDREIDFIPQKFPNLRTVPAYENFVRNAYDRCLDLVMCPRSINKKPQIDPESLVPELPDLKTLQPFPTMLSMTYISHSHQIRCLSVDPSGKWLAAGSEDGYVFVWDIFTGRCIVRWYIGTDTTKSSMTSGMDANKIEGGGFPTDKIQNGKEEDAEIQSDKAVRFLCWNPQNRISILLAAVYNRVILLTPRRSCPTTNKKTQEIIDSVWKQDPQGNKHCQWAKPTEKEISQGHLIHMYFQRSVIHTNWHQKGNYFLTVLSGAYGSSLVVHQLSKCTSQAPLRKSKGSIQCVLFHPTNPLMFVATQRTIRVYDLVEKNMSRKINAGVQWISSMDIHPDGDNIIVGSYDKALCWFDMELSNTPYKKLQYHSQAIRFVCFHRSHPLFATCSDDGTVNIFHCTVYSDLLRSPLIVPLKKIKAHGPSKQGLGVLHCEFHPTQPWLFTCGTDGKVHLFTDIH